MLDEDTLTPDEPRVLVAVMNNRRDFLIAREEGWYRIPYERGPSQVGADFLAFYQTKAFDEEHWMVKYFAPIRRYRIVPRMTLIPDEADHPRAGHLYYKLEIGSLQTLPRPIPSHRLRRITFIPTTLERLLQAQEINDLWLGSAVEERLWQAFKENGISAERHYALKEDDASRQIDFALFCARGKIAVLSEGDTPVQNVSIVREQPHVDDYDLAAQGWTVLDFSPAELTASLPACVDRILDTVAKHGGPSSD
jgi:hypothetical protein